jgi:imidazolonepropionase
MAIALACTIYRRTPAEAIVGATYNAAYAIGLGGVVGTLTPGAAADLVILDMESYRHLPYHYGVSHVRTVVKSGRVVVG